MFHHSPAEAPQSPRARSSSGSSASSSSSSPATSAATPPKHSKKRAKAAKSQLPSDPEERHNVLTARWNVLVTKHLWICTQEGRRKNFLKDCRVFCKCCNKNVKASCVTNAEKHSTRDKYVPYTMLVSHCEWLAVYKQLV